MSSYQQAKLYLVDNLHLAKDALHIYVALAAFFGSCLLFGWKVTQWRPLVAVACAGEIWDLHDTLAAGLPVDPAGHAKDIANTMLVPAVIVLLARYSRVFRKA